MDVNVEDQPDRQPTQENKKDQGPSKPATTGHLQEAPTTTNPPGRPTHARSPGLATEEDINLLVPPPQTKRRGGASSMVSKSSASSTKTTSTATGVGTSANTGDTESASPSLTPRAKRPSARRTSTTSTDSMDQSQGYGSTASSSSMGRGGGGPMRPMPPQPPQSDMHVRLTPITGRVSRAKKGVPVHVCEICKPHKTFTRAEHLRRHQLGHGTPQFQCPGCDRAFHRQDLLTRHQQKNEHGGDTASKSGSAQDSPHPSQAIISSRAARSSASSSVQPGQQIQPAGSAAASSPTVTEMSTPPVPGSSYTSGYEMPNDMSPIVSVINPEGHYRHQPRTAPPMPLHVVTQNLLVPGLHPPDFSEARDTSPWPSSASDSTYSTPVSEPGNRRLFRGTQTIHSQFPNTQGVVEPPNMDPMPMPPNMYVGHYTSNPQPEQPQHSYGAPMYSLSGMTSISYGSSDGTGNHQSGLSGVQLRQDGPNSSIRGSTPPSNTTTHTNGGLLAAQIAGPQHHSDPLIRYPYEKGLAAQIAGPQHHSDPLIRYPYEKDLRTQQSGLGNFDMFQNSIAYGGSGNASPTGDNGSHGRMMEGLDLEHPVCTMSMAGSGSMAIPLPSPINGAIPRYLETYWSRVHPTMPVVHRKSYERQPEGVLTCAMAAVATQFLEDKEDRTRGSQLHDYAWQEVKRIAKWDLQTKQAILLCEYFARFRGRNAVTSPSNMFRSLYERVSTLQSFTAPPSSSLSDHNGLWLFDPSAWSPTSSHSSSASSSCGSITPTTTAMSPYALRHLSSLQTAPPSWSGFSSPYPSSTTSSYGNTPISLSDSSSLVPDFSLQNHHLNPNASSSSPDARSRAQRSWSSLFAPVRYNPAPAAVSSLSFQLFSENTGQLYSQCLSNPQGLSLDNLDHTMVDSNEQNNLSLEAQWSNWIQAEAGHRLLTACFLVDGHMSIYQQLPRVVDYESDTSSIVERIRLFGRSQRLWEASSAEEWADILNSDPGVAEPQYVPEVEHLTAESIRMHTPVDQMVILGRCALQLPRRPSSRTTSVSENNTPAPDFGHRSQHLGVQASQINSNHQAHLQGGFPMLTQEQRLVEAESRITDLFGDSPIANTYLALHHTPLRDLLAVSGDSWLFSQKVLPANLFQDHQKRLLQWVMNKLAGFDPVKATVYASRAITLFLVRQPGSHGCGTDSAPWSSDLSDYWGLYVCSLICWAFCFHAQQQGQPRQRSSSGENSPASRGGNGLSMSNSDEDIISWLQMVGNPSTTLGDVSRLRRREAVGVVRLVRRKLESDCIGGRNRLYVDAVGVLERLEREQEGRNRKLF
ncbi:hypothetical protein QBC43DRAFT_288730 [Cladorrhinum sp. PSN259]|nr:hypothetical protein QBC43DRAFT_288730 [Cladorrhinum sp. PSN259]